LLSGVIDLVVSIFGAMFAPRPLVFCPGPP
jgi:hypothetical protein